MYMYLVIKNNVSLITDELINQNTN